jgi:hypothetical protein
MGTYTVENLKKEGGRDSACTRGLLNSVPKYLVPKSVPDPMAPSTLIEHVPNLGVPEVPDFVPDHVPCVPEIVPKFVPNVPKARLVNFTGLYIIDFANSHS